MIEKWKAVALLAAFPLLAGTLAAQERPAPPRAKPVMVHGDWAGIKAANGIVREFNRTQLARCVDFLPRDSNQVPKAVEDHECDVGMVLESCLPSDAEEAAARLRSYCIGRLAISVAVNAKGPVRSLTLDELRRVFDGTATLWSDLRSTAGAARIELYSPLAVSHESSVFRNKVLLDRSFADALVDRSVTPRREKLTGDEVIGAVAKETNGIGFFLDGGKQDQLDKRVRVLAIASDKGSEAVLPSGATIAHGSYPLVDAFTLYVRPDAPPLAREFCQFAAGPEAAEILKRHGLWPEYELKKVRGELRLKEMQAGKGTPVVVCGLVGREGVSRGQKGSHFRGESAPGRRLRHESRDGTRRGWRLGQSSGGASLTAWQRAMAAG